MRVGIIINQGPKILATYMSKAFKLGTPVTMLGYQYYVIENWITLGTWIAKNQSCQRIKGPKTTEKAMELITTVYVNEPWAEYAFDY